MSAVQVLDSYAVQATIETSALGALATARHLRYVAPQLEHLIDPFRRSVVDLRLELHVRTSAGALYYSSEKHDLGDCQHWSGHELHVPAVTSLAYSFTLLAGQCSEENGLAVLKPLLMKSKDLAYSLLTGLNAISTPPCTFSRYVHALCALEDRNKCGGIPVTTSSSQKAALPTDVDPQQLPEAMLKLKRLTGAQLTYWTRSQSNVTSLAETIAPESPTTEKSFGSGSPEATPPSGGIVLNSQPELHEPVITTPRIRAKAIVSESKAAKVMTARPRGPPLLMANDSPVAETFGSPLLESSRSDAADWWSPEQQESPTTLERSGEHSPVLQSAEAAAALQMPSLLTAQPMERFRTSNEYTKGPGSARRVASKGTVSSSAASSHSGRSSASHKDVEAKAAAQSFSGSTRGTKRKSSCTCGEPYALCKVHM